jgi:hypothetical protein
MFLDASEISKKAGIKQGVVVADSLSSHVCTSTVDERCDTGQVHNLALNDEVDSDWRRGGDIDMLNVAQRKSRWLCLNCTEGLVTQPLPFRDEGLFFHSCVFVSKSTAWKGRLGSTTAFVSTELLHGRAHE